MVLASTLDDLLAEGDESVTRIQHDPEPAFQRLIAERRSLIAHLPESAPIEDVEAALGVKGTVFGSGFLTRAELDAREAALLQS